MRSPETFVGRAAELRRVARLWKKSRLVVVGGVGGIGKTAFARRIVERFSRGRPVFTLACRSPGSLEDLEPAMDLTPALGDRAVRIASHLDRSAAILVADDIHLLGPEGEKRIFEIAARLERGHVVATSRTAPQIGDLEGSSIQVALGPLAPSEATALVARLLERAGHPGDARALARASAGNPLWCRLLAGGVGRVEDHLDSLLEEIGPDVRAALERLCVQEAAVPAAFAEAPADVLRELTARFLVERMPGGRVVVHDVVRDMVRGGIPPARLALLHRAAADRSGAAGDVAQRLRHLEASRDWLALRDALHEEGAAWLFGRRRVQEVIRLVERLEAQGATPTPRLRRRRALSLVVLGRIHEARDSMDAAGAPAGDEVLHAAIEIALLREEGATADARRAVFEAGIAHVDERCEPTDVGLLVYRHLWDAVFEGRIAHALGAWEGLGAIRRRIDAASLARILDLIGIVLHERGEVPAAERALGEARRVASSIGSPELVALVDQGLAAYAARWGDAAAARRHLAKVSSYAVNDADSTQAWMEGRRATVMAAEGRLGDAVALLDAALDAVGEGAGLTGWALRSFLLARLAAFASESGDVLRARFAARTLLSASRKLRPWHDGIEALIAHGRLALAAGRFTRAARIARAAVESARRSGWRERGGQANLVLAEALATIAPDHAAGLVDLVRDDARRMGARLLECRAEIARARILVSTRPEAARGAARDARRLARAMGNVFLDGRAALALGWAALALGDDPRGLLREARDARRRAGAPILDREARALDLAVRAARGSRRARDVLEGDPLVPLDPRTLGRPGGAAAARFDVFLDGATGRAVIDGRREVRLGGRPVLCKLLRVLIEEPTAPHKDRLFDLVWGLRYRPEVHDPVLYKAVERLRHLLDPKSASRFLAWDEGGRLVLGARRPGFAAPAPEAGLGERQKWLLGELRRRPGMTNQEYAKGVGVTRTTALRDLQEMVARGLLRAGRVRHALVYRLA